MPIYGYVCQSCGHQLDALQKISDDPLTDCPACEQSTLKRQLSAPRFRLKGQGWYETDFKSDNQRNLAGESKKSDDKPADKKDSAKTDKKTESKPAKSDKESA